MNMFAEKELREWNKTEYFKQNHKQYVKSKTQVNPINNPNELPPLYKYPLDILKSHLARNQKMLNDREFVEKLPDKGKKLYESNKLIKEAIHIKLKFSAVPPPSVPNKVTKSYNHTQTRSLSDAEIKALRSRMLKQGNRSQDASMDSINEQIKKLSIGNKSYTSSSETSSSSRESLSSISSLANSSENIAKLRNTINKTNLEIQDISYSSRKYPTSSRSHTASREDIYKQQSEQERRRQHEAMLHKMANHPKGTKPKHIQQSQRRPLFTGFDCDDDDSDDFDGFSEDEYC